MQQARFTLRLTRTVAYIVIVYGLSIIATTFIRQLRLHPGHHLDIFLVTLPQISGLGFVYLGSLLLRRKYNAWLAAVLLFVINFVVEVVHALIRTDYDDPFIAFHILFPLCIIALLWVTHSAFQVLSDVRSFTQALRVSLVVLLVALLYGVAGFTMLDRHDFHTSFSASSAVHQTLDQVGLTTDHPVAHSRRARLFMDSLSVISISALLYTAISFFDPIRMRMTNQDTQRLHAEKLLRQYPSDIDDFFKLWPHDKLYFFDSNGDSGLAYHVSRGVALVVGDPFGNPQHFNHLVELFIELCFVNDWTPAFVHVSDAYANLYEKHDLQLQKIGQEAVVDLRYWIQTQTGKKGKYFREIRNRFTRLGYSVEIMLPPHSSTTVQRVRKISDEWLSKPGRAERGFMLGYYNDFYLQQGSIAVARSADGTIQGFMNLIPTYSNVTANYDLLRCSEMSPGNCNDFLLMCVLDHLQNTGIQFCNLGLSPLAGLKINDTTGDTKLVDNALRFLYSNGDRLYSFSGLHRFKSKYQPVWHDRYIAYPGGVRSFTRVLAALNKAMKVTK